ncbi:lantibiotic dehydratase [Flagellimonas flava]|uniref:lantibiotic dehydratase n=1 Tax=Flagellimonas flava TaxID=570519 RepID=UPI003D65C177
MDQSDSNLFDRYSIDDTFIVRIPLLPLGSQGPNPEWEPPQTGIRKLWSEIPFRRAVQHAAPGLSSEIKRWLENKNPKKTDGLWYTLMKYYIRSRTRATPFGLFAGPTLGRFASTTELCCQNIRGSVERFEINLEYNGETLEQIPSYDKTLWFPNPMLYSGKDCWRYWDFNQSGKNPNLREVARTKALERLLERAQNGVTKPALVATLSNLGHSQALSNAYLQQLVDSKILLSETAPSVFHPHITVQEDEGEKNKMNTFINSYPQFQQAKLDHHLMHQLGDALKVSGLFSDGNQNSDYAEFTKAFLTLFGTEKVRLVDAMDGEYGLGYPIGQYRKANSYLRNFEIASKENTDLAKPTSGQKWLLAQWKADPEKDTIQLWDEDLKLFVLPDFGFGQSFFGLVEWIGWGEKTFCHPLSFGGASAAVLHARHGIGNVVFKKWAGHICDREENGQETLSTEVAYLPPGNESLVACRPMLRKHVLHLNNGMRRDNTNSIALDDLWLHHTGKELVLTHGVAGKHVKPYLTTAHDHHRSPLALYRFLGDHQFGGKRRYAHFNWGPLPESTLRLPRVLYRDVLVAKRQWHFAQGSIDQLEAMIHGRNTFKTEWPKFCQHHDLPKTICWSLDDQRLVLDTEDLRLMQIFIKRHPNDRPLVFEEYLPPGGPVVRDTHGNAYASEFQFSFLKKTNGDGK